MNLLRIKLFQVIMVLVLESLLLSFASSLYRSSDYVHLSNWNPDRPPYLSDYEKVSVWGFPVSFVVDNPSSYQINRIDASDAFNTDKFLLNWMVWFVAISLTYSLSFVSRVNRKR